ncbi:M16 family metallopeptidase [Rhodanobacter glycinis]|uniref:Predicted Zn-dependent peptidase n=1 Tax=Rhodanobacter glycinis TaxID=582702 RepID=A0A1I4CT02_9GAMM|nr:pitrilysin family protein [Rhodanobacter glycinis]SFK84408.1 Predicted Zn-dependent peptidase [Rhodanobacter glycinis]
MTVDIPVIDFSKFHLDNGLTVIVHEDHKSPVVAVSMWYHVGSANEPPGKTGFAHLFEHLMFSGSEHHRSSYFRPFELIGATDQNGTTWFDRTNYFETVPSTALDVALWMESDRMGHLLDAIGQQELDTQRGVVQNEKRQNENQPYGRSMENIQLHAFPANHPYQHTTIGSMADLDAASLDDVKQWFRDYYGAANTVLVLAGDITPAMAREKAERYFGHISSGPSVMRPASWIAPRQVSTRGTLADHVPQVRMVKEWNVPPMGHKDVSLLELAAWVLGGGTTSRMYQRLVYRDGLADSVSIGVQSLALVSMFMLEVGVRQSVDPALVEAAIADEWSIFLKDGPTEDELARAKAVLRLGFVSQMEKVGGFGGKAAILAQGELYRGDPAAYRIDLARRDAATTVSVLTAARQWIAQGDYTLTVLPAIADQATIDSTAEQGLPAVPDKPATVIVPVREFARAESKVDRSAGVPSVETFPELTFPAVQRGRLKNGIEVVLAERHAIPMVQVQLQFDAGFAADRRHQLGLSRMTGSMLDQGTLNLDSVQIAKQQQRLGAQLGVSMGLDTSNVGVNALSSSLAGALELLADMVRHPAFREADFERQRALALAAIQRERSQPGSFGGRVLPPLLYGKDHAYGIPFSGIGTGASVNALTTDDLHAFHRVWIRPDNATILVVGDTRLDVLLPLLDAVFGDWTAPVVPRPDKNLAYVQNRIAPRVLLVHRPDALQSHISAVNVAPPTSSPGYTAVRLANTTFGGTFTSRLNMNLREDKRWSYGARSNLGDAIGQRLLTVSAPVQTDKTAESMREMLREMEAIAGDRPPTQGEIDKVKVQGLRMLPGGYESSAAVLQTLCTNKLYGRPDDYALALRQRLEGLTVAQVAAVAEELFSPEAFTWLIEGDLSKIETPVRSLRLGDVSVLDVAEEG